MQPDGGHPFVIRCIGGVKTWRLETYCDIETLLLGVYSLMGTENQIGERWKK